MSSRKLVLAVPIALLAACQSFSEVCRDAAAGPGWESVAAPDWANTKLAELGWPDRTDAHWYFDGGVAYRVCRYRSGNGVPRCGGPVVAEYRFGAGEWSGGLTLIPVCH